MRRLPQSRVLIYSLIWSLVLSTICFVPFTSSANSPIADDEVTIDEGARQFDEGVRDVGTILQLDLSTERGVKQADTILKRNAKKLAHYEKKALQAAARVESFKKGLKDEAAKRKGGDSELATELESKPGSVGNIAGAEEAAEAIKRSTKSAADILGQVSEALKNAGEAAKKKNEHHARSASTGVVSAVNPPNQGFCAGYQYICDLLTRLALYELRRMLAYVRVGTTKATCVLNAYSLYGSCIATRWWEQALCSSNLASRLRFCLLYA
jgi:hypothetical protein